MPRVLSRKTTHSSCYMCTVNCPITVVSDGDEILSIDHPACVRGGAMVQQRDSPDRITSPRIRESADHDWREVSWDDALSATADELLRIRAVHGPESVVFVAGYTKEVRPYLRRLAHYFGSPHYVTESSCCFASGFVAATVTLGEEYEYFLTPSRRRYAESKCRLVWSGNPAESQIPYARHHLIVEASDVPTIVVDPRRTQIAEVASIHLQLRPGTDGALALGLAHVIFAERLHDQEFVEKHAYGVGRYRKLVEEYTPAKTGAITGIPSDMIVRAGRLYGESRPAQITISPNATTHHANGFQAHRAILLLAALCGNLDVDGGNRPWSNRLKEKSIDSDVPLDAKVPALGAAEFPLFVDYYHEAQGMLIASAIESGRVKAVFSVGMNLMMWPNSRRVDKALRSLDLFTTCDFFETPTVDAASVFFPAATHLERQALIVAGDGRVQYRPAAVRPRGAARGDTELIFDIARHLGLEDQFWGGDICASFDERLATTGFSFADLPSDGKRLHVIIPAEEERSYRRKGFGTCTGKVEFVSTVLERAGYDGLPVYSEPAWSPSSSPSLAKDYPLVLTSGGRSGNYTNSQGRVLETLRCREPEARLQINPIDAATRGIHDGERIAVRSPIGRVEMQACVTDVVPCGVVHAFHGWAGHNINEVIPDEVLDPISGFPAFKSTLCEVNRVTDRDSGDVDS